MVRTLEFLRPDRLPVYTVRTCAKLLRCQGKNKQTFPTWAELTIVVSASSVIDTVKKCCKGDVDASSTSLPVLVSRKDSQGDVPHLTPVVCNHPILKRIDCLYVELIGSLCMLTRMFKTLGMTREYFRSGTLSMTFTFRLIPWN